MFVKSRDGLARGQSHPHIQSVWAADRLDADQAFGLRDVEDAKALPGLRRKTGSLAAYCTAGRLPFASRWAAMAWAAVMVMVTRLRMVMVQVSGWLPSAPELLTLGVAVLLFSV